MKKLLLLLLIVPMISFGQTQDINVNVTKTPSAVESFNEAVKAGAASDAARAEMEKARAARANAMSEPFSKIITPVTVDFYDYTHIALVGATCTMRSKDKYFKDCYNNISNSFKLSPLTVINPVDYNYKMFKKNPAFLRTIKNSKWVYVTYRKSIQGVDDIRSLTIRNSQNKVLYKIEALNIPMNEVISVLTDF